MAKKTNLEQTLLDLQAVDLEEPSEAEQAAAEGVERLEAQFEKQRAAYIALRRRADPAREKAADLEALTAVGKGKQAAAEAARKDVETLQSDAEAMKEQMHATEAELVAAREHLEDVQTERRRIYHQKLKAARQIFRVHAADLLKETTMAMQMAQEIESLMRYHKIPGAGQWGLADPFMPEFSHASTFFRTLRDSYGYDIELPHVAIKDKPWYKAEYGTSREAVKAS